jgi:hypothetical protein
MTMSILRRFVSVLAGLLTAVYPASGAAQPRAGEVEILSKADATRLFRLTKPQWISEIRTAVASGAHRLEHAVMPGMTTTTPEGDLLTVRLDYSKGEDKPFFIQVSVGYRAKRAALFTDQMLRDVVAGAERQMAPEFEIHGDFQRFEGGVGVFFHISER